MKKQPLGQVLRAARVAAGLTQPELAYLAGTTPDRVSAIELGKSHPRWPMLARIMRVLDLNGDSLVGAIDYEADAIRERRTK